MCGVNSVITANELDVCGCDSAVYDEVGNSNGVEVIVSIDDIAVMTHCHLTRFVLVAGCRFLVTP